MKNLIFQSNPRARAHILDNSLRPLLFTDGVTAVWDGLHAVRPGDCPWKERDTMLLGVLRTEMRVMAKEGLFPEAQGAWIDSSRWWALRDWISGYRPCDIDHAELVEVGK
jgi:hypothetical protein